MITAAEEMAMKAKLSQVEISMQKDIIMMKFKKAKKFIHNLKKDINDKEFKLNGIIE